MNIHFSLILLIITIITTRPMLVGNEQEVVEPNSEVIEISKQFPIPKFECVTIHQLDCIYYGEINKSYQREGFGILQTIEFDTYFGFWKNGKAEGVGLIVYSQGSLLYGHFYRNQFFGPVIVDDKETLKISFCEGNLKVGLGYEYTYSENIWKMIEYTKSGSSVVLREEEKPIGQKLPDMLLAQHSLGYFLTNYLSHQYFKDLQTAISREKEPKSTSKHKKIDNQFQKYSNLTECLFTKEGDTVLIGLKKDNQLQGLGCIFEYPTKSLYEAGYYYSGYLQGFAFQKKNESSFMIGSFEEGLKNGLFFESAIQDEDRMVSQFYNDNFLRHHKMGEEAFKKRQKAYNYQQKDFLSAPNAFLVRTLKKIAHDTRQLYRPSKERSDLKSGSKPVSFAKNLTNRAQLGQKSKMSNTMVSNEEDMEPTSLQMLRAKMIDYELVSTERFARQMSLQRRKGLLNSKARIGDPQQQQQIAQEQNPFDSALLGINLINQSPARRPN